MQTFEPDQLVLVRESDAARWRLTHYSHTVEGMNWNVTIDGKVWASPFIIPYAGNEHLLGTTKSTTPKWEPKPGELVAMSDDGKYWTPRIFIRKGRDGFYYCATWNGKLNDETLFKLCEPLRDHFAVPEEE